ncbi:MAG: Na+:solute symporter [Acidobacteria bacterium]|nr:Na+:solute symporter [Acidobacteriota bacterium]
MQLATLDLIIVVAFLGVSLAIGIAVARRAGSSHTEFFLSGRNMPWWLLGVSMVATTFSTDTPNLVTDIVRTNGVAGNWVWWAFLLTGMLTTFLYARLWRRSGVETDIGFYEIRYSGRAAAFLRGFRALYLGVFFNVMIMATVTLAAIKIGGVMLGLTPTQTVLLAGTVTLIYSMLGGLTGVILTDFLQFGIAMFGSIAAAWYALARPEVGGLEGLLSNPEVQSKLDLVPDWSDPELAVAVFVVPLAVQWWATWYPGSEPGGGGYIAQRMLAARDERHAQGATLLFNVAHYALRPWPWILVALASIVVFPDLASLQAAFPQVDPAVVRHDLAYPAMLTFLPTGLLGIVVASLVAAYMSTISTHLNWGASYIVNDWYGRFVAPDASEKRLVLVGRLATAALMIGAGSVSLLLSNALQGFQILLQIGAGTGLLFILRWFWWRINAQSEIAAMVVSFGIAAYFQFIHPALIGPAPSTTAQLLIGVSVTTVAWLAATFATAPTDPERLRDFYRRIRPAGPGWAPIRATVTDTPVAGTETNLSASLACMALGSLAVYGTLFGTGNLLYGNTGTGTAFLIVSAGATAVIMRLWNRL